MRFQFRYCRDESTVLWYGENYHDMNYRWHLSRPQMRVLAELRGGKVQRDVLRRKLLGEKLTAAVRASLSRMLRRMVEQNLIQVEGGDLSLTECGQDIHDDLMANGCKTLTGKPLKPLPPLAELIER